MDCDHWLHTSWCWTLNLSSGLLLWPGVQCSSWPVIMSRPAKAWRRDDRWSIKSIFTLITDILRIKNVQRFAIQLHFHQFWIFGASLSMKTNAWHLVHSLLTLLPLLTLLHGAWCCEHNISDQMRPSLVSTSRTIALCPRCAWLLYTHTVFTADISGAEVDESPGCCVGTWQLAALCRATRQWMSWLSCSPPLLTRGFCFLEPKIKCRW